MTRKALPPLLDLDPVLGQNMELGLCVERMDMREMILLGPPLLRSLFFSYLLALRRGSLCDPKQGQGVELAL